MLIFDFTPKIYLNENNKTVKRPVVLGISLVLFFFFFFVVVVAHSTWRVNHQTAMTKI